MTKPRRGLSLLELIAVITLMGILVAVVAPRFSDSVHQAKGTTCQVHIRTIELQSALWNREKGQWPQSNFSDIKYDTNYFPDEFPVCPVDGSPYLLNTSTGRVRAHSH